MFALSDRQLNRLAVVLAFIVGFIIVWPSLFFRYWDGAYRGVDFFASDAEDGYLAQIQEIYDGHYNFGNPYLADQKNQPYLQQSLQPMIVAGIGWALGLSASGANILTKFLFPVLVFLIIYLLFSKILKRKDTAIVIAAFIILTPVTTIFMNPASWGPFFAGKFMGTEPQFLTYARSINPQISSLFFFGYLLLLWKYLFDEETVGKYTFLGSVVLGLSFYTYFFCYSFNLVLTAILGFWYLLRKDWFCVRKIFITLSIALIIAIPYFINLLQASQSVFYIGATGRLGAFNGHDFIFSRVWFVVTILCLLFRKYFSNEARIFVFGIIATAFVVTNQQVITGFVIPVVSHYHWYYIAPILESIFIYLCFVILEKYVASAKVSWMILVVVLFLFITSAIFYQEDSYWRRYNEFVQLQRYAPVLSWVDSSIQPESTFYANPELSDIIPSRTHHNVYQHRYMGDYLVSEERLKHVLFLKLHLDGIKKEDAHNYFYDAKNRDWVGAHIFGQRFRMQKGCYGCFPDETLNSLISEYIIFISGNLISELKKYPIDYIIWDKRKNAEWRLDRYFGQIMYNKDNIVVYKF